MVTGCGAQQERVLLRNFDFDEYADVIKSTYFL